MAGDLNRCEFIGRLGADPERRLGASGVAVTRFSIAVNSRWRDRGTGEQKTSTQWIKIVAFRRLAEVCDNLLHKGAKVFVAGEFSTNRYEREGEVRIHVEVIAREMQLLESAAARSRVPSPDKPAPTPPVPRSSQFATWGQTHPDYRKR